MAGKLASATLQLNNLTPVTNLTVTDFAVSQKIDFTDVAYSASFPHCDNTRKAILLSKVLVTAVNEEGVSKSMHSYIGRDIHKMLHCNTRQSDTSLLVDASTKLDVFFGVTSPVIAGFWMPMQHNGTSFTQSYLSAEELNDLFLPGVDFHIGLKLSYTKTTPKTLYAPCSAIDGASWIVDTTKSARVAHSLSSGLVKVSVSTDNDYYCSFVAISTDFMRDTSVLGLFGLTASDIDPSTQVTITPFAYVGAEMSGYTQDAPTSLGYFHSLSSIGVFWDRTNSTPAGTNNLILGMSISDTYNSETLTNGDYGWLGEYASGDNTDTSINISITSP